MAYTEDFETPSLLRDSDFLPFLTDSYPAKVGWASVQVGTATAVWFPESLVDDQLTMAGAVVELATGNVQSTWAVTVPIPGWNGSAGGYFEGYEGIDVIPLGGTRFAVVWTVYNGTYYTGIELMDGSSRIGGLHWLRQPMIDRQVMPALFHSESSSILLLMEQEDYPNETELWRISYNGSTLALEEVVVVAGVLASTWWVGSSSIFLYGRLDEIARTVSISGSGALGSPAVASFPAAWRPASQVNAGGNSDAASIPGGNEAWVLCYQTSAGVNDRYLSVVRMNQSGGVLETRALEPAIKVHDSGAGGGIAMGDIFYWGPSFRLHVIEGDPVVQYMRVQASGAE